MCTLLFPQFIQMKHPRVANGDMGGLEMDSQGRYSQIKLSTPCSSEGSFSANKDVGVLIGHNNCITVSSAAMWLGALILGARNPHSLGPSKFRKRRLFPLLRSAPQPWGPINIL